MDAGEIMGLIGVVSIVFIPSLAFAARFALKPIVESILRLREGFGPQDANQNAQIFRLERAVDDLRRKVEQLESERDFDRALAVNAARQIEPGFRRQDLGEVR